MQNLELITKADYQVEELYIGMLNKKIEILHANKKDFGVYYKFITHEALNDGVNNEKVEILDPLKNYLENIGLNVLLIKSDGNYEKKLTAQEIDFILHNINKLNNMLPQDKKKIETISEHLVQAASELLGINTSIHPKNYHLSNDFIISEVIVSAKKESIFKHNLFNFIKVSFLTEENIMLIKEADFVDYRISRSLNVAKIPKEDMKLNIFDLRGNINGDITVNGKNINSKIDKGFQKKIKK